MKLTLTTSEFGVLAFQIKPESLRFSGTVEGYDHNDKRSYNSISFTLEDESTLEKVKEKIHNAFALSSDINDYFKVSDNRIRLSFRNGSKGWADSPDFHLGE